MRSPCAWASRDDLPVAVDQRDRSRTRDPRAGRVGRSGRPRGPKPRQRWAERAAQVGSRLRTRSRRPPATDRMSRSRRASALGPAPSPHAVAADARDSRRPSACRRRALQALPPGDRASVDSRRPWSRPPSLIESPSTDDGFRACGLHFDARQERGRACSFLRRLETHPVVKSPAAET